VNNKVVIVGAKRTPIGSFQGQFATVPADELGAAAIVGALDQAGLKPDAVDDVLMGCVLPAGIGQLPHVLPAAKLAYRHPPEQSPLIRPVALP